MVSHTAGFREASFFKVELGWYVVQATGWHTYEKRHGTIYPITKTLSIGIKLVHTCSREWAMRIDYGGGFRNYPVAFFPVFYLGTKGFDGSTEFMSQDDRIIYWPAMVPGPLMEVTPAHTDPGHPEKHVILSDFG